MKLIKAFQVSGRNTSRCFAVAFIITFSLFLSPHVTHAATFVNDTFTDTAGTTLASHTGETGATWTIHPSFPGGEIVIDSANRIRTNAGSNSVYYTSGNPAGADYDVQGTVTLLSSVGYLGLGGRMSTTATTFYFFEYDSDTSQWELYEFLNGAPTLLSSLSESFGSIGTSHTLKLSMRGTTISGYSDGVLKVSGTDSGITAAGFAGIVAGSAVTNTTGQHLDNFSATDATSPSATSYTFTGPTGGIVNTTSTNFTVTPNAAYAGTITPSDSAGGGTFSPTSLTFASSSAAQTFTYRPASAGNKTISVTSSPALTNPSSITYSVAATSSWVSNFTDNFNRSDGAIGNGWLGATSTATISSNKVTATLASGNSWSNGLVLRPVNEALTDQRVTATYLAGSLGDLWMALRTQSPGTEYILGISHDGHANIWKVVNDALTGSILQAAFSYNSAHDYQVDASATGTNPTSLSITITDLNTSTIVATATTTDSTSQFQQNGQVGFFAATNGLSLDDFTDYSLSTSTVATSYTLTGPTSGTINTASTNFTVTPNGLYTGTITPGTSGLGTFSPTSLTYASSSTAQTFTYTPTSTSSSPHTISVTSSPALTNPSSLSYTVNVPSTSIAVNNSNLFWSKSNVYVNGSSYALMLTTGSYLKTNFSGTSFAVNLDVSALVSASVSATNYPIVRYQVDGGSWTTTQLTSTTTSIGVSGLSSGTHSFRFEYVSSYTYTDKWNTPVNGIKITSLSIDSGSTVSTPTILSKTLRVDGDSITEGLRAINSGDTPAGNSAVVDYAYLLAQSLGTELTQIGYGSQGWSTSGQGNVPTYPNAVDYYYNGVSRLSGGVLPQAPDYWIVNQGTNDGGDITSAYLTRISQMRTEAGSSTQIFLLIPFNQSHKTQITSAYNSYITANPLDKNVHLIDLGSISYTTTDGLHPDAAGHQTLATALTSAINTVLATIQTTPTVTTSAASAITTTSALLNGNITADGNASTTVRGFNLGLTTAYTSSTTQSGTFNLGSFSATASGLTANTLYHYRAYATNIAGTAYGSDQTFTTSSVSTPVATTTPVVTQTFTGQTSGFLPGYAPQIPGACINGALFNLFTGAPCITSTVSPAHPISPTNPTTPITSTTFTLNLQLGSSNTQVKLLQQYLNTHGFIVSVTGAGSIGNETNTFGFLTKAALIKFQKASGIVPASGYFGPITRAYIASH